MNTYSNEEIIRRSQIAHPIIIRNQEVYKLSLSSDQLFNIAFTWDPEKANIIDRKIGEIDQNGNIKGTDSNIRHWGQITTYHTCGYPMFFKPSAEEVLKRLPNKLFEDYSQIYYHTDYKRIYSDTMHEGITDIYVVSHV